jgi:hypothetical protein
MKRLPKSLLDLMRVALPQAWEEGYRQAQEENRGTGMGAYGGYRHVNPYKDSS